MSKPKIVSIFSGVGGLDAGFHKAGFETVFATDIWELSCESFIKNFPKLQELHVVHCEVNSQFVTMLRSLEHNIQKFTFRGVTTLNQSEMQTYCTQNGIELSLA